MVFDSDDRMKNIHYSRAATLGVLATIALAPLAVAQENSSGDEALTRQEFAKFLEEYREFQADYRGLRQENEQLRAEVAELKAGAGSASREDRQADFAEAPGAPRRCTQAPPPR